jgi:hypothetical protein
MYPAGFAITRHRPMHLSKLSCVCPCIHKSAISRQRCEVADEGVPLISVQKVTVRTCLDREDWRGVYFDGARKCLSRLEFLLVSRAAAEGLFAWSISAASARFRCSL